MAYAEIQDAQARDKLAMAAREANGSAKVRNFLSIAQQLEREAEAPGSGGLMA